MKKTQSHDGEEPKAVSIEEESIDSKAIKMIIAFLQLFMCETLAKRVMGIALLAIGLPLVRVKELTGLCQRSVYTLRESINKGELDDLFVVGGGGRKSKLVEVESAIIEEIQNNNYRSRRQIADMIEEKYGIKLSLPAVGNLLKKTESNA